MTDGGASISFDNRYWPVIVATWVGAPTLALVAQAQAWLDAAYAEARANGTAGLVVISEASMVSLPDTEVRRRILELRHDPALMIKVVAVVPARNKLARSVVNALVWVLGDSRFMIAASLEHAAELAERAFHQRGLAVPDGLDRLRGELLDER